MNAFSKPFNHTPDRMTVIHGRKGQSAEYIEYRLHNKPVNFVAQKAGNSFVVFRVERGRKGSWQHLATFYNADPAAHQAHDAAMNEYDR